MGKLLYAWDPTANGGEGEWIPVQCDADGNLLVDLSGVNLDDLADVNAPTPADQDVLTWEAATSKWIAQAAAGGGPTIVLKTTDEVVNNSDVLQDDDELLFAIGANEIWEFTCFLNYLSGDLPSIKVTFAVPSGAVLRAVGIGIDLYYYFNGLSIPQYGSYLDFKGFGTTEGTSNMYITLKGYVINGANAGNIQLQWAQSSADASDTTVKKGSNIIAHKL